jgi:serine phosphatase RsbU (regulator of sigma subunit)
MWLSKKPSGPTPEELAEQQERERREAAEAELRRKITLALEKDQAFQVMTVDGVNWICPYTLTLVPAAFGHVDPAREYLFEKQPFRNAKPRPVIELIRHRWLLHLKAQVEYEPRLRISGPDQRWLNPYSGTWVKLMVRPGAPAAEVLEAVATALAASPQAQQGKMLELVQLREIEQRAIREASTPAEEAQGVNVTKRVSGKTGNTERIDGPGDDMSRAKSIMERMLTEMPEIPGFGVSVHYEPHSTVGGDFFACLPLGNGRYFLAVADVAGHGVQGAFVVVAALKALRFIIKETQDLAEILVRLNDSVKGDLLAGQFITCWAGILRPAERQLEMVCAGHHPAGIANIRGDTLVRRVSAKGPALGLLPTSAFRMALRPITITLETGDTLMQCTDGLLESSDPHREEFGELRAMGSLLAHAERPYADLVDRIAADGRRFAAGTFQDDVTVMILQCDPPASVSGRRAAIKPANEPLDPV